jgi:hypothetical protein
MFILHPLYLSGFEACLLESLLGDHVGADIVKKKKQPHAKLFGCTSTASDLRQYLRRIPHVESTSKVYSHCIESRLLEQEYCTLAIML